MYMIMRGITVKQYSLTIYNSYSKRNKTPHHALPIFAFYTSLEKTQNFFSSLQNSLYTESTLFIY